MKKIDFAIKFVMIVFWVLVITFLFVVTVRVKRYRERNSLNVLAWGGVFPRETLKNFEKESGIKVNLSLYTTNEELLTLLKTTKGESYDLIVPSDYAIKILKKNKLLKKLDKTKFKFLDKIHPAFLNKYYDLNNEFSIPYIWELYGLGINKKIFDGDQKNPSWGLVFDDPKDYKIVMVSDPIEAISMAAFYLFGQEEFNKLKETRAPSGSQIDAIKDLLILQQRWLEAYTSFRPDYYLLTKNCPLVVSDIANILRGLKQSKDINFLVPKEGTFLSIENFAIPASSKKENEVYSLINYLYGPRVLKRMFEKYDDISVILDVFNEGELSDMVNEFLVQEKLGAQSKIMFFGPILPEEDLQGLWVQIKS